LVIALLVTVDAVTEWYAVARGAKRAVSSWLDEVEWREQRGVLRDAIAALGRIAAARGTSSRVPVPKSANA
jgi:hypothetical protein